MTISKCNHNYPIESSIIKNESTYPTQPRKRKKSEKIAFSNLERINMNAAGIDIASGEHWVCVPPEKTKDNVKKFGTFTCENR
jgi:hypothetical protein